MPVKQPEIIGAKEIRRGILRMRKVVRERIAPSNLMRAELFKRFLQAQLSAKSLGLESNTAATRKIQRAVHPPLFWTGTMADTVKTKSNKDKSASAGFFASDDTMPPSGTTWAGWPIRPKLTWTEIANLQETGWRIPTDPDDAKGARVRAFLSHHGVHLHHDKKFIKVVPRPFMQSAGNEYFLKNKDIEVMRDMVDEATSEFRNV